jgi:hypothetical protein
MIAINGLKGASYSLWLDKTEPGSPSTGIQYPPSATATLLQEQNVSGPNAEVSFKLAEKYDSFSKAGSFQVTGGSVYELIVIDGDRTRMTRVGLVPCSP